MTEPTGLPILPITSTPPRSRAAYFADHLDGLFCRSPAPAASQGTFADSDDELWLQELCRAPPAPPKRELSINSSDEAWLESLCRRHSPGSAFQKAEEEDSMRPLAERPNSQPMTSRLGGATLLSPPAKRPKSQPMTSRIGEGTLHQTAKKSAPPVPPDGARTPACPHHTILMARLAAYGMPLPDSTTWKLPEQDSVVWHAPQSPPAASPAASQEALGTDLHRCLWFVLAWLRALSNVAAFKIGIAFDPEHRWNNDEFGYRTEQMWMFMHVMYAGLDQNCRSLEIALIQKLKNIPGCYNERPGGEGVSSTSSSGSTCHCYAVFAPAGDGVSVHTSWRHRQNR